MCDDQRVDHDPNAAIELPEDVGVRHGVACARKAAQSVRVSIGAAAQRRAAFQLAQTQRPPCKDPEPVGCWESFIKGISSIWSTIDFRTGKETDIALSKSDPEKGIRSAEDEEKEKKRKALQVRARHMFSRIL